MDNHAIFKLSYGVFVVGTVIRGKKNACIINTAQQVTAIPEKISITVAKTNLTHDMIQESSQFSLSILGQDMDLDIVNHFGMQSGRTIDKFASYPYKEDTLGNPYIEQSVVAVLTGKVIDTVDLGTHTLFVASLVDGKELSLEQPITYNEYRTKKAELNKLTLNKDKASGEVVYECTICHYQYVGETPFEEISNDYICPICKQPKNVFIKK